MLRAEVDRADLELVGVHELGPEADSDFAAFDSGDLARDLFLRTDARRLHSAGTVRTFVSYHATNGLVGYIALLSDSIGLSSGERRKVKPLGHHDHPRVPGVKVAHVAVSLAQRRSFHGTGTALMGFAVTAANAVAGHVGCRILTLDAQPDAVRFYQALGFVENKDQPTPSTVSFRIDLLRMPAPVWFPT